MRVEVGGGGKMAKKQLRNDGIRNINHILRHAENKRDACRNNMTTILDTDQQLFSECLVYMNRIKQLRCSKTLLRHIN